MAVRRKELIFKYIRKLINQPIKVIMRLKEELPINAQEKTVEAMLVNAGIDVDDIQFHTSMGKSPVRYLRVGYWKHITGVPGLEALVTEEHMWDDDCGNLFYYSFINTL